MKRRLLVPKLYGALFELAILGKEARGYAHEDAEAARLAARVRELETKALHLLGDVEIPERAASH